MGIYTQSLALFITGAVIAGMGQGISFRAGMGAIAAASPVREKAAVTSTFFVVAYIAISVPVIGLGLMASVTSLKTTGITFAAVMGSLAALALALLIRRERAAGFRPIWRLSMKLPIGLRTTPPILCRLGGRSTRASTCVVRVIAPRSSNARMC